MGSFGKQTSELQTQQFPGLFGTERGMGIGNQLQDIFGAGSSQIGSQLINELLNPTFGATTASEQALLRGIEGRTGGRTAARGLGAPTEGGLAKALAPELIGLRQDRVSNLLGALGAEQGFRGQDIQGLLELAGLSMPQIIGGQKSGGFNFGVGANLEKLPFSDKRLKENIVKIGKLGVLNLYSWTWNSIARGFGVDNNPTIGVMAQEAREVYPDAVIEHSSGYLMVDYGRL